jgi:hypothetical protein
MPDAAAVTISFFGRCFSRSVILLEVGKCEGKKRGVQAEIVLHPLEYISEGKAGTKLAVTSTFNLFS